MKREVVLDVVECDWCGLTRGYPSEAHAEREGWRYTSEGTKCPDCAPLARPNYRG